MFSCLIVCSLSFLGCSKSGKRGKLAEHNSIMPSIEVLNSSKEKNLKSPEELYITAIFNEKKTLTTAYLCNNGKTTKYHLKADCRGLSNCSYKVVKTTLEKVIKDKKTLCKWEE